MCVSVYLGSKCSNAVRSNDVSHSHLICKFIDIDILVIRFDETDRKKGTFDVKEMKKKLQHYSYLFFY